MISPDDTMAASLWRDHLGYANTSCLEPKRTVSPSLPRPTSSVETSLPEGGNGSDPSELPYLGMEPVEAKELEYASPTIDSLDSGIDSALLMAMLSGEDTAVEGIERSIHSRPMLYINPVSVVGNNVLSAPSPIDSGYSSRPDTPSVGMCGYGSDESTWSPVDDTSSISDESSNTHMLPEGFSDAKYWNHVTDAKTSPAPQGPVIPRIVLSDEEGRVLEATIDDQFGVFSSFNPPTTNEDADSPYGGLMSLTALEKAEPAFPVSCFSSAPQVRSSATGAVLDRAFVSLIRTRTTLSATTSIYHNRHRAPTFVLDCVGEEEEEEEEQRYEVAEERGRVGEGCMFFTLEEEGRVESEVDVGRVRCRTDEVCSVAQDSISYHDAESLLQPVGSPGKREFNTWHFEDGEDDECEECGLFLTEPDDKYYNLFDGLSRLPTEPTVMFGLLKAATRVRPNELNTAYHMAVQGCTLRTCSAPCLYNCERGYWGNSGGISSIACPLDCPAHGGRDVCKVDAIFRRSTLPSRSTAEPDCAGPDYQTFAAEVVGLAPLERKSAEEDLDDSDLVLHSGEKFRPTESKNTPPNAGASYDEYMSHFMDDVDLSGSSSNDNSRTAPFGKFVGGALKDMTVPEAVDHLKEGLERTESAFRAALTAPFRFNSVADRLTQHLKSGDPKVHPPKERRGSNAFRHHRKESSASGIKTKWSNMLNKFTR